MRSPFSCPLCRQGPCHFPFLILLFWTQGRFTGSLLAKSVHRWTEAEPEVQTRKVPREWAAKFSEVPNAHHGDGDLIFCTFKPGIGWYFLQFHMNILVSWLPIQFPSGQWPGWEGGREKVAKPSPACLVRGRQAAPRGPLSPTTTSSTTPNLLGSAWECL